MYDWFTPTRWDSTAHLAPHVWVRRHLRERLHVQHMQPLSSQTQPWCLPRGSGAAALFLLPAALFPTERSPFTARLLRLLMWWVFCSATTDVQNSAVVRRKDSLRDGGEMMPYSNSEFLQSSTREHWWSHRCSCCRAAEKPFSSSWLSLHGTSQPRD